MQTITVSDETFAKLQDLAAKRKILTDAKGQYDGLIAEIVDKFNSLGDLPDKIQAAQAAIPAAQVAAADAIAGDLATPPA